MNHTRIEDYLDNRMTAEESAEFQAVLKGNQALAKDVESAQAFRSALRSVALQESVPNLQPLLADIARPKARKIFAKWAPAAAAAIAVFGIGIAANRVFQDQVNPVVASAKALPPMAHIETKSAQVMAWNGNDPATGAAKIRETFYRTIPDLDLRQMAQLRGTRCGSCWFNFRYEYKGSLYDIYGRCETGNLDSGQQGKVANKAMYVFSDAVGWYDKDGMTYTVLGGNPNGRLDIARAAAMQTGRLR